MDAYFTLNTQLILPQPVPEAKFKMNSEFNDKINVVYIHPFMTDENFYSQLTNANGIVLCAYGLGNFPVCR